MTAFLRNLINFRPVKKLGSVVEKPFRLSWKDLTLLRRVLPEGDYSYTTEVEMQKIREKSEVDNKETWQSRIEQTTKGVGKFMLPLFIVYGFAFCALVF